MAFGCDDSYSQPKTSSYLREDLKMLGCGLDDMGGSYSNSSNRSRKRMSEDLCYRSQTVSLGKAHTPKVYYKKKPSVFGSVIFGIGSGIGKVGSGIGKVGKGIGKGIGKVGKGIGKGIGAIGSGIGSIFKKKKKKAKAPVEKTLAPLEESKTESIAPQKCSYSRDEEFKFDSNEQKVPPKQPSTPPKINFFVPDSNDYSPQKESKKVQESKKKKPMPQHFSYDETFMMEILKNQRQKGFWNNYNKLSSKYLSLDQKQLSSSIPKEILALSVHGEIMLNIWLTIIILVWLNRVYGKKKNSWKLISKKSEKWLKQYSLKFKTFENEVCGVLSI